MRKLALIEIETDEDERMCSLSCPCVDILNSTCGAHKTGLTLEALKGTFYRVGACFESTQLASSLKEEGDRRAAEMRERAACEAGLYDVAIAATRRALIIQKRAEEAEARVRELEREVAGLKFDLIDTGVPKFGKDRL